jgi:peptide/nickel transport system substrate-binding protein
VSRAAAAVVVALAALLAALGGAVAAPSFTPAPTPAPTPVPAPVAGHVQGVIGRPSAIMPVLARTQADRDLVALLFRGLVRLGPGTSVLPDLAGRWTVEEGGTLWTFHLREDARWHDGEPVTSADVVFTVRVLQHPDYGGPLAATWAQVAVSAPDARTVRFSLGDPVGGFLQAATLPLLPAHLLDGVPVAGLADSELARNPVGNGIFALIELTDDRAVLEPVLPQVGLPDAPLEDPAAGEAGVRTPLLARLELRFFDTADALAAAFEAGEVDAAVGLQPADAVALSEARDDSRVLRYPASTLTAIAFNLRSLTSPFADQRARRALLAAIDREALVADLLGGAGRLATSPIPPSSWAYDEEATQVAYDREAALAGLREAGWKREDGKWIAPRASKPLVVALLAPERTANPLLYQVAERVAEAWTAIGLTTEVEALPPGAFVERLRTGDFLAAVIDVNMGLDPDPYPILGSTQAIEGGSNISGIQVAALDRALRAARAPGPLASRREAYASLQDLLETLQPMPALFFRDVVVVVERGLVGPEVRPVADLGDRFWDVVRWRAGR